MPVETQWQLKPSGQSACATQRRVGEEVGVLVGLLVGAVGEEVGVLVGLLVGAVVASYASYAAVTCACVIAPE